MITREDDGIWMIIEETLSVHHEEVFAAITTEVGLIRWFSVTAEIDLRQGGLLVLGWDPRGSRTSTVAILDYDAGGTIVWDWYAARDDLHAPVYWRVEPSMEEGSRVTLRQGPFSETAEALMVMADEAQMWRWYLCNLRTSYEAKMDMRKVRPI